MARSRPACRRSSRSAHRTCAVGNREPRTLGAFFQTSAEQAQSGRRHRPCRARRAGRRGARRDEMMPPPLLAIENLRVVFHGDRGRRTVAVDGVDLSVARGPTLGLVGESGCGKSVTSLAVMGLLPKASAEVSGAVTFDGIGLLDLPDRALRDLRGDRLAMIFQEPMTSLNPRYTVGEQIV